MTVLAPLYPEERFEMNSRACNIVAERLRRLGFVVSPGGQSVMTRKLREWLRSFDSPYVSAPDLYAYRDGRGIWVDPHTTTFAGETVSLQVETHTRHLKMPELNVHYAFVRPSDDIWWSPCRSIDTSDERPGSARGSGTPWYRIPVNTLRLMPDRIET